MRADREADDQDARRAAALHAMARELRAWAAVLPQWSIMSSGTWDGFRHARRLAEDALTARLRSLPGCSLGLSSNRMWADLDLAGVHVRSHAGLEGVCAAWASKADDFGPSSEQRGRTRLPW